MSSNNRDKSELILDAVTVNDIFTDCLNSSFDNVFPPPFISLRDESLLKISSAQSGREENLILTGNKMRRVGGGNGQSNYF